MSFRALASALGNDRLRSRSIARTAARVVLSLGLVASVGVVLPAAGLASAGASVVPASHHGPGGGGGNQGGPGGRGNPGGGNQGGGGGGFGGRGFRHIVIVSGTVGSVGATSFTLTRGVGPITPVPLASPTTPLTGTATGWTVDVSQYTHFLVPGTTSPNLSDVVTGDKVTVTGRRGGAGIVNANLVVVPLELATGAVGTVGNNYFTIPVRSIWSLTSTATTLTGTATAWTIDISGSTTFHERGVNPSTLSINSLSSGDRVTVVGSQAGALTLDAITILIEPSHGAGRSGGPGGGGGGPGGGGGGPGGGGGGPGGGGGGPGGGGGGPGGGHHHHGL
jgi:hypothetical protein